MEALPACSGSSLGLLSVIAQLLLHWLRWRACELDSSMKAKINH